MTRTIFISLLMIFWGGAAMAQTADDLMQVDRDFNQLAQDTEVRDAFLAYAADDATMMNGGMDFISGDGAVAEYLSTWPDGIRLSWEPVAAMISESGDLGFTRGTYVSVTNDEDGNDVMHYGKYTSIWQRQDDGSWKFVLDGGNPSPAPEMSEE